MIKTKSMIKKRDRVTREECIYQSLDQQINTHWDYKQNGSLFLLNLQFQLIRDGFNIKIQEVRQYSTNELQVQMETTSQPGFQLIS